MLLANSTDQGLKLDQIQNTLDAVVQLVLAHQAPAGSYAAELHPQALHGWLKWCATELENSSSWGAR
jgi:hypothetical protein